MRYSGPPNGTAFSSERRRKATRPPGGPRPPSPPDSREAASPLQRHVRPLSHFAFSAVASWRASTTDHAPVSKVWRSVIGTSTTGAMSSSPLTKKAIRFLSRARERLRNLARTYLCKHNAERGTTVLAKKFRTLDVNAHQLGSRIHIKRFERTSELHGMKPGSRTPPLLCESQHERRRRPCRLGVAVRSPRRIGTRARRAERFKLSDRKDARRLRFAIPVILESGRLTPDVSGTPGESSAITCSAARGLPDFDVDYHLHTPIRCL